MTITIKLKLLGTEVIEDKNRIHWIIGFSDGLKTSTGTGYADVEQYIEGMDEESILQLAINQQGGTNLLDNLYMIHKEQLEYSKELALFDYWYSAYKFACEKQGLIFDDKQTAYQNISQGFGNYGVNYNHSVYNLSENKNISHTFQYSSLNENDGTIYHIKIKDNVVAEWYKYNANISFNNLNVQWLALEIETGEVLEYYIEETKAENEFLLSKYDATTGQFVVSTLHNLNGNIPLPEDFEELLVNSDFKFRESIFGISDKSYGKIVEYTYKT